MRSEQSEISNEKRENSTVRAEQYELNSWKLCSQLSGKIFESDSDQPKQLPSQDGLSGQQMAKVNYIGMVWLFCFYTISIQINSDSETCI